MDKNNLKIKLQAWYEGEKENGNWLIKPQMCDVWGWERTTNDYNTIYIRIVSQNKPRAFLTAVPEFVKNVEKNKVHIRQYTGLVDKNRKEIYEGDIVRYNNELYVIKFDEWGGELGKNKDLFRFVGFYMEKIGIEDMTGKLSLLSYYEINRNEKLEVVGNIYENPELLKEDKHMDKNNLKIKSGLV